MIRTVDDLYVQSSRKEKGLMQLRHILTALQTNIQTDRLKTLEQTR